VRQWSNVRDVLDDLMAGWEAGRPVALATVVATWRSAPRQPGATMAVTTDGEVVGSVSGGCVEGAVYETALEVLGSGSVVLRRYGVSDDDALAVGLTCGGIIEIVVERVDRAGFPELELVAGAVAAGEPVAVCTVIEHPDPSRLGRHVVVTGPGSWTGGTGSARIDDAIADDAAGLLASGRSQVVTYGPDGERLGAGMRVFVSCLAPRPRLIVFGAVDFAAAVARVGSFLGYRVTVCDARATFATERRFPEADEVPRWRGERREDRRADRARRPHPRREVRRPAARRGPAVADGRLHRGDGLTPDARRPHPAVAGGGFHPGRLCPDPVADRARPGRAHSGGDCGEHRGRDRGPALGRWGRTSE
jgi:xanthine/CO dehydrogenase XdhC/CoxF family maturation factor